MKLIFIAFLLILDSTCTFEYFGNAVNLRPSWLPILSIVLSITMCSFQNFIISTRNRTDNTHRVVSVISLRTMSCLYGFIANQYVCCKYNYYKLQVTRSNSSLLITVTLMGSSYEFPSNYATLGLQSRRLWFPPTILQCWLTIRGTWRDGY